MNAENSKCDLNASSPSFYNPHFHNLRKLHDHQISREVCVSAENFSVKEEQLKETLAKNHTGSYH